MKILYIAHSSGLQGAGIAFINILNGFKDDNKIVVMIPKGREIGEFLMKNNIRHYHYFCINETMPVHRSLKDKLKLPLRLLRLFLFSFINSIYLGYIIVKERPDIIHTNTGVIRFSSPIARLFNIPHVWHLREIQEKGMYKPIFGVKNLNKTVAHKNNHCVAITQSVFDYYQLNPYKDRVIYDGVFSSSYKCPQNLEKGNYFLYVGSINEGKGIADLLMAFDSYCNDCNSTELWLAGRDFFNLQSKVDKLKFPARVNHLGFRNDIYELMQHAKALIVSSYFEGFGFIVAEAMINRCLVIGRNTTGIKEQFDNGLKQFGKEIAFRFDNTKELAELMKKVDVNPNGFPDMIEMAEETARQYTIENSLNNLSDFYSKWIIKD